MGIGVELVSVAAIALGAPRLVWAFALLAGALLIVYAFVHGEPGGAQGSSPTQTAAGGSGPGDVRGNVFSGNTTIHLDQQPSRSGSIADRTLVRASPIDLMTLYREHTQLQAEKLAEPYVDGWLRLRGEVNDVSEHWRDADGYRVAIEIEGSKDLAFANFTDSAQGQVPRLRRKDPLEVIGRITGIAAFYLELGDCELLD